MTQKITVAVVDNAPASRAWVQGQIEGSDRMEFAGGYAAIEELDLTAPAPDVLLLDLMLGRDDTSSVAAIPALVEWGARVVLHTNVEKAVPLREAIAAGAQGLHLKMDDLPLEPTVVAAAAGEFICSSVVAEALVTDPRLMVALSPRQLEVLTRIADGRKTPSIAAELHITPGVVKDHLDNIRMKYLRIGREPGSGSQALVNEARRDGYDL